MRNRIPRILLALALCAWAPRLLAEDLFLPAGYDGTQQVRDVTNVPSFPPICTENGGLPGLDLVRGYVGSSTCPGRTASQLLQEGADFTLLIDDTSPLSSYMIRNLGQLNALQQLGGRQVVRPTTINLTQGADNLTVLIVGEAVFRSNTNQAQWFALLDRSTSSPVALAGGTGGGSGGSGGQVINRVSWSTFRGTSQLQELIDAVRNMKANSNDSDSDSWQYWVKIHQFQCPHGANDNFFLAWHRGYVYLFEKKIQDLSGNSDFRLPYWNYYADPNIPSEFTRNPGSNPLYNARRNTNVTPALWPASGLGAFDPSITNFQRGEPDAFEPALESIPHNQVHNTIGRDMGRVSTAANDPIFWVHHANIDRLWSAWVAAGGGRTMPPDSDPYWAGNHDFGNGVTLARNKTINSRRDLAYDYDNTSLPRRSSSGSGGQGQPPRGSGTGALNIRLNETSLATMVPMSAGARRNLANLTDAEDVGLELVLEGIRLTEEGLEGGYYYRVSVNRTDSSDSDAGHHVGTVGPFEITAALAHRERGHGDGSLKLIIPNRVAESMPEAEEVEVLFTRVSGENSPSGDVIQIESIEIRATGEGSSLPVS